MNLFDAVANYLKGDKKTIETPNDYCPNCWGRQEYAGQLLDALTNEKINAANLKDKQGWIQAYATEHFDGIKLKKQDDTLGCPICITKS